MSNNINLDSFLYDQKKDKNQVNGFMEILDEAYEKAECAYNLIICSHRLR